MTSQELPGKYPHTIDCTEVISRPLTEDVGAPLGVSLGTRARVIDGSWSALSGNKTFPTPVLLSELVRSSYGLAYAHQRVQGEWNTHRKEVTESVDGWVGNIAKRTLSLFYEHKDNPEVFDTLQTAFSGWGIAVDREAFSSKEALAEELQRVSISYHDFYSQYCGENTGQGVQRMAQQFISAMIANHQLPSGSEHQILAKYQDVAQQMRTVMDVGADFFKDYFSNSTVFDAFQLLVATEYTAWLADTYSEPIIIPDVEAAEKPLLTLLAQGVVVDPAELVDLGDPFIKAKLDQHDPSPEEVAAAEEQQRLLARYLFVEDVTQILAIELPLSVDGDRMGEATSTALVDTLMSMRWALGTSSGEHESPQFDAQILDDLHAASTLDEQIALVREKLPLDELVFKILVDDYFTLREWTYTSLQDAKAGTIDIASENFVYYSGQLGIEAVALGEEIERVAGGKRSELFVGIYDILQQSQLGTRIQERYGRGVNDFALDANDEVSAQFARKAQKLQIPEEFARGEKPLDVSAIEEIWGEIEKHLGNVSGETSSGRIKASGRLKAYIAELPTVYDQRYVLLDIVAKEERRAREIAQRRELVAQTMREMLSTAGPILPPASYEEDRTLADRRTVELEAIGRVSDAEDTTIAAKGELGSSIAIGEASGSRQGGSSRRTSGRGRSGNGRTAKKVNGARSSQSARGKTNKEEDPEAWLLR